MHNPKKYFLSYATTHNHYYQFQQNCIKTFLQIGDFDTIYPCNESNLLPDFLNKNKYILESKHGGTQAQRAGFWIWKPYIIQRCLQKMNDGDYLFYADATIFQNKTLADIFVLLKTESVISFKINDGKDDERYATKRDTFVLMGCDSEKYWTGDVSGQLNASHMFFKKDEISQKFVDEWLHYCEDERIVTEMENTQGLPNYPGFVCHRWDQSIYSLLVKKYGFKIYTDLTQHGNQYRSKDETWGQLLIHGR